MKLFRSSRARTYRLNQPFKRRFGPLLPGLCILLLVAGGWSLLALCHQGTRSPAVGQPAAIAAASDQRYAGSVLPLLSAIPTQTSGHSGSSFTYDAPAPAHSNIITTVFWVGEPADGDNGYISNTESAWDGHWQMHYGGVDDPNGRNGYQPGAFTPKENPFYVALPYNDFSGQSTRKASATGCLAYTPKRNDHYSWCKNVWVAVTHGSSTVYAQWEDVGPFEEDDSGYVFGADAPRNTTDSKAGLDVSPAVRDYLRLGDVDRTSWKFIAAGEVPAGPWKTQTTASPGSSID